MSNAVKASLALAAFFLALAVAAQAEQISAFEQGLEAYDAGDYEAVLAAWEPLAEAGDAEAQTALAALYLVGEGVPYDPAEAARLFRLAAEQGDAVAQLNLGDLSARGMGVPRDLVEATVWLTLAARQGRRWADSRRQEIAGGLSLAQKAEAEKRVQAWLQTR